MYFLMRQNDHEYWTNEDLDRCNSPAETKIIKGNLIQYSWRPGQVSKCVLSE